MMNRWFLSILLVFIQLPAAAQQTDTFNVRSGLGVFRLGTHISQFDTSKWKSFPESTAFWKGHRQTTYYCPWYFENPPRIAGVALKNIVLTFASDTLAAITAGTMYSPTLHGKKHFKRIAKSDYRELKERLTGMWGFRGKDKPVPGFDYTIEWQEGGIKANLGFQSGIDKKRPSRHVTLYLALLRFD